MQSNVTKERKTKYSISTAIWLNGFTSVFAATFISEMTSFLLAECSGRQQVGYWAQLHNMLGCFSIHLEDAAGMAWLVTCDIQSSSGVVRFPASTKGGGGYGDDRGHWWLFPQ